ncbi:succinate dehydrogenase, hydrophobic membrane anchor protein [Thiobacter aerophilum]|uniref:Succinate dehydrogenase hydrophobic membrane anchor subunit n=1 Tax=Thiobacter aerophilum TaxID=3121275 RepID=A0ABV0EDV5_9BURK
MVKRGVTGARYGIVDWLAQRLTAVVMLAYSAFLGVRLWLSPELDFAAWRALFAPVWMRHATLLFMVALCWHAWVGMRDIYMDYLRSTGLRLAAHALTILLLLAYLLWAAGILWGRP